MMNLNGALVPKKASFFFNAEGLNSFETPNIRVSNGDDIRSEALRVRTPRDNMRVNAGVDYAASLNQTLRFNYFRNIPPDDGWLAGFDLDAGGPHAPEQPRLVDDVARQSQASAAEFPESL